MNWSLIIKTAIRDSRKDRSKLLLFMSSIILGVAALVAINSFNDNLVRDIENQSKSLLGADMTVGGNRPLAENLVASLDSLSTERTSELELFSMAYLPSKNESQFVRLKGLTGNFPYYGKLVTEPVDAASTYKSELAALVDDGMMLQYGLEVGDSIKLGEVMFPITGRLMNSFGSVDAGASFAPSVYIGGQNIEATNLIQPGSLVNYKEYVKVYKDIDLDDWEDVRRKRFRNEAQRITTVEDQRQNLQEAFSNLNNFLNIVALISLLLACIGVASSVLIYVKTKVQSIAILRCLGMKSEEAFMVYFIQIISLGTLSVILGVALGSIIQVILPLVLQGFLPYEVNMSISPSAMIKGFVMGVLITSLFALGPLLGIRRVTPLRTLRVSDDVQQRDPLQWLIYGLIFITITGFLYTLTDSLLDAIVFSLGILAAFLILYGVAKSVTWAVRKFFPSSASFVVRQGLSNLYRPNNQTLTLIVSIGLGTGILTLLFILQGLILNNVEDMGVGNQPNMIVFGIEADQKEEIEDLTKSFEMPIIQHVPVVTMELAAWKGKAKKDWLSDTTRTSRRWAINREARVSYQEKMPVDDVLLEGTYTGVHEEGDSILISLSERYSDGLDVEVGDELVWNVQGAMITTYVGSIRKINFRKMESRFFILFPTGVLEDAPQFLILVTKSPEKQTTADFRNAVVKSMPNASVIDLGSILVTLNDIITKVSYVIKFMAGFSILIGLIVLISSLFLSKFQRIRESVLLRTLGAVENKIYRINAVEYASLGILSALTGISLAVLGSYLLAKFVFELDFNLSWWPIFGIFIFIVALTVIIGLWNSRDVVKRSPLEILRNV
ncbi:MAG: putative ABC transport system permease protein [Saprospiraceae bacterium]|jgi:putative ABC transport system permease protein